LQQNLLPLTPTPCCTHSRRKILLSEEDEAAPLVALAPAAGGSKAEEKHPGIGATPPGRRLVVDAAAEPVEPPGHGAGATASDTSDSTSPAEDNRESLSPAGGSSVSSAVRAKSATRGGRPGDGSSSVSSAVHVKSAVRGGRPASGSRLQRSLPLLRCGRPAAALPSSFLL
jgi:hypothetical protein